MNWYLLGVQMNLGHAHKTRFWYLLGVSSKFSNEHPVTFIGEYPPRSPRFSVLISQVNGIKATVNKIVEFSISLVYCIAQVNFQFLCS